MSRCELYYTSTDSPVIAPPRNKEHVEHACELRLCPASCQLCKRLCSGNHLHGLIPNQNHLCGCVCYFIFQGNHLLHRSRQEHSCSALCSSSGICQIDTTPQSIEATFAGRHETFQYTKVICHSLFTGSWTNIIIICLVYARYVSRSPVCVIF